MALVTYDFHPAVGGQGRHTHALWSHLRSLGLELRVLSPLANRLPGHTRAGSLAARIGRGLGFSLYAGLVLRRWLRANSCDVLHLNGGPGGVLLFGGPPLPLVYTAHHTYAQQARLVPGQAWKRHLAALEGRGYRRASTVCAVSESTRDSVVAELGVAPERVRVVRNGIDSTLFRPTGAPKIDGAVLYAGRLDDRKGFRFLLSAWPRVRRELPAARLFVIGSGPLREWADRFVASNGLEDSVAFLPRQSEEGLVHWYNQAAVTAVPSVFEGFGLVALESMACGTPVVASDVEGLRDVVVTPEDGARVSFGDSDELARKIVDAAAHPRAINSKRVAEIHAAHDWTEAARAFAAAYAEAAA